MKKIKFYLFALLAIFIAGVFACSSTQIQQPITPATDELSVDQEIDYWNNYQITNNNFGTETTVTIKGNKRVITTNALPNHKTGNFPNSGNPNAIKAQNRTYSLPLNPTFTGQAKWAKEPGVALNGVKFEPETAERFVCETGEVYRIEAFQDLVDLGLDFNNAHVQPTGAYHYHGVPTELINLLDNGQDIILVGFALDGFPIYYSKSGQYKPSYQVDDELRTGDACSYRNPKNSMNKDLGNTKPDGTFVSDWEYVKGLGQLDECNGTEINGTYAYFVTDEYPYMSRCLKGAFTETRPKGPPPGQRRPSHSHGRGHSHRH
ncbi:MAG: YHYH protein [Bacteroidota bacterium]